MSDNDAARIAWCYAESSRQGLFLGKLPDQYWTFTPSTPGEWALLTGERQRLPDGRVASLKMTIEEVEAFLLKRS